MDLKELVNRLNEERYIRHRGLTFSYVEDVNGDFIECNNHLTASEKKNVHRIAQEISNKKLYIDEFFNIKE